MSAAKASRKELKDLLLRDEVVTSSDMNEALTLQEKKNLSLIEAVFEVGKFDEKKFVQLLSQKYHYTSINPSIFAVDPGVLSLFSKKTAEKYLALPISQHEKTLTVAFANPMNLKALDEIAAITGLRVKPAVGKLSLIRKYIDKYYGQDVPAANGSGDGSGQGDDAQVDELVKMIEDEHAAEGDAGIDTGDLMKVALETPVVKLVNMLLAEGIRRKASDIFIEPWERYIRVRARVDGLLEEMIKPQKSLGAAIVSRIKIMSNLDIAEHRMPQDGRFKIKVSGRQVDMRVSILPTSFGEKVCMRILDTSSQSHDISKLGFTTKEQTIIKDSARHPHGMILVTGPTGSGKTTTLYSVLTYLDKPDLNITTVEDPVEYQLPGINQVLIREQVGLTFPAALRSILRQDPDIILIGEIRDNETLDIAVKAALTGHLVLSTLHTNDAASSITRMVNMGLEPFLIASTVLMISAQRLIRRLCDKCKEVQDVEDTVLKRLGLKRSKEIVFYKNKGCNHCRQSGYSGRTVITEILQLTEDVRDLIMTGASAEDIKHLAREKEMDTLRDCAVKKALRGETSLEEVFRVTTEDYNPKAKKADEGADPLEDVA